MIPTKTYPLSAIMGDHESKCDTWPEARPDALSGAEGCIQAIRALKEAK